MGIDLQAGGRNTSSRRVAQTTNVYTRLLIKLYTFLVRRTNSKFNEKVLRRLKHTRSQKRPITISKVAKLVGSSKFEKKPIAVVVGTITNDTRVLEIPKLRVCATSITETARKRILAAGGEVLTFDQLAQISPDGKGTVLLKGNFHTEKKKSFGKPGVAGAHAKPKMNAGASKHAENGRGKRSSSGFKVRS
jgi:large subunit ribosomal protein L18e